MIIDLHAKIFAVRLLSRRPADKTRERVERTEPKSQSIASSALIAPNRNQGYRQRATTIAVNNCQSDSTLRKLHVAQCTRQQQLSRRTYVHSPSRLVNTKLQKQKIPWKKLWVYMYVCTYSPNQQRLHSTSHAYICMYVHPQLHPMLLTRLTAYIQTLRSYICKNMYKRTSRTTDTRSTVAQLKIKYGPLQRRGVKGDDTREKEGKEKKKRASEGKTTKRMLVNNDDGTSVLYMYVGMCSYACVCILHSKISCIKIACSCICTVQGKSCHRCAVDSEGRNIATFAVPKARSQANVRLFVRWFVRV